jgi:3-hydroxyacyl-CoA dehydrogenase/enoyl-CoA hydratase/3-hydroxybutyryl-CoA epimerase
MQTIHRKLLDDGTCVLTFDRPGSPVNIFDVPTLKELDAQLGDLAGVRVLILASAKKSVFVAGADIHLFTQMSMEELTAFVELGQAVFNRLAALQIPTVAAIHGAAVGGGYELALACDWRVASPDSVTKIGLPETKLGLIPAWGGSTRLPRLIGVPGALDVILGGKTVSARHALKLGMIDEVAPREALIRAAQILAERGKHPRSLTHSAPVNAAVSAVVAHKARADVKRKTRGNYPAVDKALDVILHGSGAWDEATSLARERTAITELATLDTTRNLIGIFFLQEHAKKSAAPAGAKIERAAVIGAGAMGAGIAQWLSTRGLRVVLRDVDAARVAAGMTGIAKLFTDGVRARALTEHEARTALDRITPAAAEVPLRGADIVIEAAVEKMAVKKAIFHRLDELVRDDTILATNTSALSITELAAATSHPQRVVGIHFFNPVHKMQLVEVVTGDATAPEIAARAVQFVQRMGKLPVVVRDRPGFLVNRILLPYLVEAGDLFAAGADPVAIDDTMLDFGMPMGPLRLADEVGIDIAADVAATLAAAYPNRMHVPAILGKMIDAKMLGRKSGAGFYRHEPGGEAVVNPAALALRPSATTPANLAERLALLMVNEAAACLGESVVASAGDIDLAMVMGTGWAPFRGGPLRYADSLGAQRVFETLSKLAETAGPHYAPCARIAELARTGGRFYEN